MDFLVFLVLVVFLTILVLVVQGSLRVWHWWERVRYRKRYRREIKQKAEDHRRRP